MNRLAYMLAALALASGSAAALPGPTPSVASDIGAPPGAFERVADNATEFEATMWNIVKKSGKPADYEAYLEVFPNGQYAGQARDALARLRTAQPKAPPKASRSIKLYPKEKLEGIGRTFVVRTDANLRAAPGTDARIVGRAAQGETIFVLGRIAGKDWYKVSTRAGLVAYIATFLVGEPGTVAPAPKAAAPKPAPPPPAPSKEPDTQPAPAAAPAATPAPARKSPEEIREYWTRQIEAVKNSGPYGSCDLVVGNRWEDPPEYDNCEANNSKIKALEEKMERALADR